MSISGTKSLEHRAHPQPRGGLRPLALFGLLAGPFLAMVDSNIVNVALPDISTDLRTNLTTAQWSITAYLLATMAVLPASAYLSKRFGTRTVYLLSIIGFTLASVACALAPTIHLLVALRVVQGAVSAPMVPLAMGMLLGRGGSSEGIPPAAGLILFLAPALGPTLGGLLIGSFSWHAIFLINLPIGIVGALGVLKLPRGAHDEIDQGAHFDGVGLLMLATGLTATIYGTASGPTAGWFAGTVWPFWAFGALLVAAYVVWALRRPHPAVDLKLLREWQTTLATFIAILTSVVLFSMLFLLPIVMQTLQGQTALATGLALLPQGLATGLGTILGNNAARRWGLRPTAILGMAILAASTAALLVLRIDTPTWTIALLLCGRGLALGLVIQQLLQSTIGALAPAEVADGNTLFNVAQRLGGSASIPLLATFFQRREEARVADTLRQLGIDPQAIAQPGAGGATSQLPEAIRQQLAVAAMRGFHDTIWVMIALAIVGLLAALLLRNRVATRAEGASSALMEA